MSNDTETQTENVPAAKAKKGSRLPLILVLFALAAGGVYGMRYFLDAQIPTGDDSFVRKAQDGVEKEEPPTGLEVIQEMFSSPEDSKVVTELKGLADKDVAFSYEQISKMSKEELEKNIADLTSKLSKARANLGASFGAGSMGPGGQSKGETEVTEVQSMALPLEVMREMLKSK